VLRHDDGKEDEAVVTGASAARRSANLMSAMGSREQLLEWYQCRHQPSALSLQPRFPHNTRLCQVIHWTLLVPLWATVLDQQSTVSQSNPLFFFF